MNEENRPQDPNAPRTPDQHGSAPPPPESYLAAPGAITPEPPAAPQAPLPPPPAVMPPPPNYYQPPVTPTAPPAERNSAPPPPPQWAPRPPMPPPPGGGHPQPGYGGYTPPPKPRNRMLPVIAGLVLLVIVLVGAGGVLLIGSIGSASRGSKAAAGGGGFGFGSFGSKIAVLEIEDVIAEGSGTLANTKVLVSQVDAWRKNSNIKALVLRINSPGGAVSATQDLYAAINRYKAETGNPVIASLGDVAASGGYYTAVAADEIWANEGSLTGSIGVIMSFMDYQGLQDKIGIHSRTVKSGEFKDMGSGSRAMTEREKELLGNMITDVYEQFFEAVYDGRKEAVRALLSADSQTSSTLRESDIRDHLRAYADGRIFSGRQARSIGMIDEIGTLDEAIQHAAKLAKLTGEPSTVRGPARATGLFGGMGAMMNRFSAIAPVGKSGVTIEYRLGSY